MYTSPVNQSAGPFWVSMLLRQQNARIPR